MPPGLVASVSVRGAGAAAVAALAWGCGGAAAPRDAGADAAIDAPPGIPDLQFVPSQMTDWMVTQNTFREGDCEVVEGCVGGPGERTLLRFDTVTANRGTADVRVGMPPPPGVSNDIFEWSPCHGHHHFTRYITYELIGDAGPVISARKRAFCLQDNEQVQAGAPPTGYTCTNQGISRGWADSYTRDLDCQWIDATGVPPGHYTLRIVVNPEHVLPESNYDDDVFTLDVQL